MRYGIRYNPNKKMIEFLDIDEISPDELIGYIDADDYWGAQKKFTEMVKDLSFNSSFTSEFFNNNHITFAEATKGILPPPPQHDDTCL